MLLKRCAGNANAQPELITTGRGAIWLHSKYGDRHWRVLDVIVPYASKRAHWLLYKNGAWEVKHRGRGTLRRLVVKMGRNENMHDIFWNQQVLLMSSLATAMNGEGKANIQEYYLALGFKLLGGQHYSLVKENLGEWEKEMAGVS